MRGESISCAIKILLTKHFQICDIHFRNDTFMALHWQKEHFKFHGTRSSWIESARKSKQTTRKPATEFSTNFFYWNLISTGSFYNHTGSLACKVCRKIFSTKASLSRHKCVARSSSSDDDKIFESSPVPASRPKECTPEAWKYFCKICNYEASRRDTLLSHLKSKRHISNEIDRLSKSANQAIEACSGSHCCQINLHS